MFNQRTLVKVSIIGVTIVFSGLCSSLYIKKGIAQRAAFADQHLKGSEPLKETSEPKESTIVPQQKESTLLSQPWANVRDFGAVGDGKHDDTAAFQRALDTNLTVLIPKTDVSFVISKTLYVNSRQTVMGLGKGSSIVKYTGTESCFMSDPKAKKKHHYIAFRNFMILGTENAMANGITLIRANNSSVENVLINDIGGIGIIIDGAKGDHASQAHYAYIQNVEISGTHKIGLQLRGRGKGEGSNRHRIFFLKDNGATEVAMDFWQQSNTSNIYGFAAENVHSAVRMAGRRNLFYGFHLEKASGNGVEFVQGAGNNIFYGANMTKVSGQKWANPQYNPVTETDDDDEEAEDTGRRAAPGALKKEGSKENLKDIKPFLR